jgi:hypothetical protein
MKIPELKRSGIRLIAEFCKFRTDFPTKLNTEKMCSTLSGLAPTVDCAPHVSAWITADIHPAINLATFTHSVCTWANGVKFAHQLLCNPKISTLLKAVCKGFLKGCPNLSKKLILKYLNPSPATPKGNMKRP